MAPRTKAPVDVGAIIPAELVDSYERGVELAKEVPVPNGDLIGLGFDAASPAAIFSRVAAIVDGRMGGRNKDARQRVAAIMGATMTLGAQLIGGEDRNV